MESFNNSDNPSLKGVETLKAQSQIYVDLLDIKYSILLSQEIKNFRQIYGFDKEKIAKILVTDALIKRHNKNQKRKISEGMILRFYRDYELNVNQYTAFRLVV